MKSKNYRTNSYRILYRFLKEHGIFCNYIANVKFRKDKETNYSGDFKVCQKVPTPLDSKKLLYDVVDKYMGDSIIRFNHCRDLFTWGPSSFYWDRSIEGQDFWIKYFYVWRDFYEKHKKEYNLE